MGLLRMWRHGAIAGLLLALASLAGARPLPIAEHFREGWATVDGLPHNLVNDIVQTPDGYLWFATWEGLARFNGRTFTVFDRERLPGLADAGVRALHADRDGRLWIGGARGSLAVLDGREWRILEPVAGLVNDLHVDRQGRLWVGTETAGLYRIDADGTRHRFGSADGLAADGVYSIAEGADGRLWIGTLRGLSVHDSGQFRSFPPQAGLPNARVFDIAVIGERLLLATERGAFELVGTQFRPLHAALQGEAVTRLVADAQDTLWAGTINRGLVRLVGTEVERFGVEDGLPNNRVLSLFVDRDRHVWAGSNAGLMRFREAPFSTWTRRHGLPDDYVRALLEHSDGSLWIGTSEGIGRLDGDGRLAPIAGGDTLPGRSILSLAQGADGDVWIGTYTNGLLRWRDGRVIAHVAREHGVGGNEVRALLPDAHGAGLWVGTSDGLTRIDDDGRMHMLHIADGLPGAFVVALHRDRASDRIWIGTGTGLAVLEDGVLRRHDLSAHDGAEFVFGFHQGADGAVWMATDRGLIRHRDGVFSGVSRQHGLPFDKVFNIVADDRGHFWIGSNRGVVRIARDDADAVADRRRLHLPHTLFGEADGMISAQCNGGAGPAALRRADGSIWFATAIGAVAVQPARLHEFMALVPPAMIESFEVAGVPQPLRDAGALPPGTGRIGFDYVGLAYVTPHRIQYRTLLEGFDADWVDRGNQTHAEFTNLAPGDYRFRVRASYPDGAWRGSEASLAFSITPFVWQRPLFWALLAALAVAATVLVHRLRLRQLARSERRLRELVALRTSDLTRQTERLQQSDAEKGALLDKLREQSAAFARQAREDDLTGLANRRAFDESLAREFARAARSGASLCVAMIDIDHFKTINDGWSHAVGDAVLRATARIMRSQFREIDALARWGGEEFALLMPYTALEDAVAACERLRRVVESHDWDAVDPGVRVTVSIGVAAHAGLEHHEKLVSRADAALYRAKQTGRNRVCSAGQEAGVPTPQGDTPR